MNLFDFHQTFKDEDSCIRHFKELREGLGITCKKCTSNNHYWKNDKKAFQCKDCGCRMSLKSGTALENSNLPYLYWYKAIHLLTSTKKTFSALELQRQLGHKSYESVWAMLHKIRVAMGKRDSRYKLKEYIELDDGFFETVDKNKNLKGLEQKRGRGSQKQSKVLVLVESEPVDIENRNDKYKYKPNRKVGHLRMIVMNDLQSESINTVIEKNVSKETQAISDSYKGYNNLQEKIRNHEKINTSKIKETHTVLPWVHSAIGNAKKVLQGIHHSIGKEYLQNYLDEFCYKYNRRYFGDKLFERLLIACVEYK